MIWVGLDVRNPTLCGFKVRIMFDFSDLSSRSMINNSCSNNNILILYSETLYEIALGPNKIYKSINYFTNM